MPGLEFWVEALASMLDFTPGQAQGTCYFCYLVVTSYLVLELSTLIMLIPCMHYYGFMVIGLVFTEITSLLPRIMIVFLHITVTLFLVALVMQWLLASHYQRIRLHDLISLSKA